MNDRAIIVCDLHSTADAARYLEISPVTLGRWRSQGKGPRFILLGDRCIRYKMTDLNDWLLSRSFKSSHEYKLEDRLVTWAKFRNALELLAPYEVMAAGSESEQEHDDASIRAKFIYIVALADLGEKYLAEFAAKIQRCHLDKSCLHVLCREELSPEAKAAIDRANAFVLNRETDRAVFYVGETEAWTRVFNRRCFD